MKNYMASLQDLRGNAYLNPSWPAERRPAGYIQRVAVHHDAAVRPHSYDSIALYRQEAGAHYTRLGPGLQYHFKIDNVGTIFWIRGFDQTVYALGDYYWNQHSLNICLDGYFHPPHNQQPTREQLEALEQLLAWLDSPDSNKHYGGFPYTKGQTFAHREFSATACCGNNLAWRVAHYRTHGVVPKDDVPYDWPEYQPAPAPAPAPAPQPSTPAQPEYVQRAHDVANATYVATKQIGLINLANGQAERTYAAGTEFNIARTTAIGETQYLLTKYSADKNIWKGLPAADLKVKEAPAEVPQPPSVENPTPLPTEPPVPNPEPPKEVQQDEKLQDHEARLGALEKIVKAISDFLASIFKGRS